SGVQAFYPLAYATYPWPAPVDCGGGALVPARAYRCHANSWLPCGDGSFGSGAACPWIVQPSIRIAYMFDGGCGRYGMAPLLATQFDVPASDANVAGIPVLARYD